MAERIYSREAVGGVLAWTSTNPWLGNASGSSIHQDEEDSLVGVSRVEHPVFCMSQEHWSNRNLPLRLEGKKGAELRWS